MEQRLRENLHEKTGVVSNLHGFLYTHLDGGFREKWSGYWNPPYKYLDYFAVKVNGVWLTGENLVEVSYGDNIVSNYETSTLRIKQEIKVPERLPGFRVEFEVENKTDEEKAVQAGVEVCVDIRRRTNDIEHRKYDVEAGEKMKVISEGRHLEISGEKFEFEAGPWKKEHHPGTKQVGLIPGTVSSRCELGPGETGEASLILETDGETTGSIETHENSFSHPDLGRTFNYSVESMENLIYDKNGRGIFAGHPWFQNYWARDTFWTVLGLVDAGYFEEAEKILENFAENDFPGKIESGGGTDRDFPRFDTVPLFAIAVDHLDSFYGTDLTEEADEILAEKRPRGKIVEHDPEGTWMDTLERKKAVDIQSLWIEALERFGRGTTRLKEGLKQFETGGYMSDSLEDSSETINPAIPLMFGQVEFENAENYLEKINGEFSSRFGARTRSVTDEGYEASGYHTGSSWGLTTGWAAAANFEYRNFRQGVNFLEKMTQFVDRNQIGGLPEVVDSENGALLGCGEQAWSAGLFVHAVDSYLLGIKVEEGKIVVDPSGPVTGERKSKRVPGGEIDLKFEEGTVEVTKNTGDLEVEKKC